MQYALNEDILEERYKVLVIVKRDRGPKKEFELSGNHLKCIIVET